ncbi:WG repeat-containing protein [Tindallia californiensis]|uniref:WG containing repeat-containing protein n=1 Tax=Tindallia californiensis TaxID=159292 RepID=A0A1H3IHH0_9FIRM|nr:WG repeat-containing protein [Tindallia californiensis]SDY26825.1 WG containing repeat-containing protein [Tindallia californiensis]
MEEEKTSEETKETKVAMSRELTKKQAFLLIGAVVILSLLITGSVLFLLFGRDEVEITNMDEAIGSQSDATQERSSLQNPGSKNKEEANVLENKQRLPVKIGDYWGYVDIEGNVVIEAIFDEVDIFSEGVAFARYKERVGFIDKEGHWIISPVYEHALPYHNGIAAVRMDGKWGYIDIEDQFTIKAEYEDARSFSEGRASVKLNNRWGYIDENGVMIVEPQFKRAWNFFEGIAQVETDGGNGYINLEGDWIWNPEWNE